MTHTCDICGKEFYFNGETYLYKKVTGEGKKTKTHYFCGWNCMRKYEKSIGKKSID